MNNLTKCRIFLFTMTSCLGEKVYAQEGNVESVRSEIKQMDEREQNAFVNGECMELMSLMDENITFFVNGRRVPSKESLMDMCQKMPRPFEKNGTNETKIYVLTKDSGYVVKTMEFANDGKVYRKEVVTKIWRKDKNGWKMTHLHSTVKDFK